MTNSSDQAALAKDFWEALEKTRTVMLGSLAGDAVAARPMTAQVDDEGKGSTIYFFASREEGIGADVLAGKNRALLTFQPKDHSIMASGEGTLVHVEDQAIIDRLWSVFASLYYDDGKQDPNLLLLRFDTQEFDVWRSSTTGFGRPSAHPSPSSTPSANAPGPSSVTRPARSSACTSACSRMPR